MEMYGSHLVRLQQLQAWLAAGWVIEEPILVRSAFYEPGGRVCAFEIVVKQQNARRVIALPDAPDVQQFLGDQQLALLTID